MRLLVIAPWIRLMWVFYSATLLCGNAEDEEPETATRTAVDGTSTCAASGECSTEETPRGKDNTRPSRAPHDQRGGYLRKMKYDVGLNAEHSLVYVDLSNSTQSSLDGRRLCKMYNLSPRRLHLIRQDDETKKFEMLNVLEPVSTAGVTCTVGDHYIWLDRANPQQPTHEVWVPDNSERHFVYKEPYDVLETSAQRERYIRFHRGLIYEEYYRTATGRSYLGGSYPPRPPPEHPFWPADYVGQEHLVELDGVARSLLVFSTSPRVLIMDNFLNPDERAQILSLADAQGFEQSTTLSPNDVQYRRTSQTSWLLRDQHPLLRSMYRRASQLLRIPNLTKCCAEDLQVVHYDEGQEYRAHFDFKLPGGWAEPVRFATLLIYLEDPPLGGQTVFPLAAGGTLAVPPRAGTAVLFYSTLPDGNVDERSLHSSAPVEKGHKRKTSVACTVPRKYQYHLSHPACGSRSRMKNPLERNAAAAKT
eukprot:scaffold7281_cov171-Amphora_coffeaeformis.AAC.1